MIMCLNRREERIQIILLTRRNVCIHENVKNFCVICVNKRAFLSHFFLPGFCISPTTCIDLYR